ncbi:MAG TPA: polysaccharide pyruvyl transferase family protein [Segeticoccus sp.]|nr:polysaccharide pyruvyl transferase family protein [Segeticoccus sp.]
MSAEAVLAQDVIATNIGNLLFSQSVMRALSVPGADVVPNSYMAGRRGVDDAYIARINDEFDHFVVPLANAFRPSFQPNLERLTRVVRGLDMPVTVVGVGSQHPLEGAGDDPSAEAVKAFMAAVLDRSASVGVRGELTADYLAGLGFGDAHVEVIGCPSLHMDGPEPAVTRRVEALGPDSAIATSASPDTDVMSPVIRRHAERFPHLVYVPQNSWDLNTLVWGEAAQDPTATSELVSTSSPLHLRDQVRFPLDPRTWVDFLRGCDFAFGTRLHGTVAAILAGTPAVLLAHDSRTLELADYHRIPYKRIDEVTEDVRAEDLYEEADFSAFHAQRAENFERFTAFLGKNGLPHIYEDGAAAPEFDRRLREAELPPLVHPLLAPGVAGQREVMSRIRWLRQGKRGDRPRTAHAFTRELPHTEKPPVTVERVDKRLTRTVGSLDRQRDDLSTLKTEVAELRSRLSDVSEDLRQARRRADRQAEVLKRLDVLLLTRARRHRQRLARRVVSRISPRR